MTLAQWITTLILAFWPMLFAASFWFFRIPERQRDALKQFAPIAARLMQKKDGGLNDDTRLQLAIAFVAEAFQASHLPHYPEKIVKAAIEAEL
jgi:hypothetical protein